MTAKLIDADDPECVAEAVRVLRSGGLIGYPTDTVYGIGAAAGNEAAVRRLFEVKGREAGKALPLLLADGAQAEGVAEVGGRARALMERFWPGALTIVMRKAASYDSPALGGGETVALRVPDHDVVRAIVRSLGEPLTGTSANRAGSPAARTAAEVVEQLGDAVELVIDGGVSRGGVESTIIDVTSEPPRLLREGAVSRGEVEAALGQAVDG